MVLPPRKKSPRVLVFRIPHIPIPVIRAKKTTRKIIPILITGPFLRFTGLVHGTGLPAVRLGYF
jgi:hypothetical protein